MIVRKLRLQRGWSRDQLAELMDVIGAGLAIQALFTLEIIRLPFQDWEKRLAEKKLGRKL